MQLRGHLHEVFFLVGKLECVSILSGYRLRVRVRELRNVSWLMHLMNVLRLRLSHVAKRLLDLRLRHILRARVLLLLLGWIAYLGAVRIHA